jgi:hypothetical protein
VGEIAPRVVSGRGQATWLGLGWGGLWAVVLVGGLALVAVLTGSACRADGGVAFGGGFGVVGGLGAAEVGGGACCDLRFACGAGGGEGPRRLGRGCSRASSMGCLSRCCRVVRVSLEVGGWVGWRWAVWVVSVFEDGFNTTLFPGAPPPRY